MTIYRAVIKVRKNTGEIEREHYEGEADGWALIWGEGNDHHSPEWAWVCVEVNSDEI